MRVLDLFCGAGGAAYGYYLAGWGVTGVDIMPQPSYPFTFIRGDALRYLRLHGNEYDFIHASPPCQAYSTLAKQHGYNHPDLIGRTRELLKQMKDVCWVIENVPGATLAQDSIRLCGSMFNLKVRRHRLFESNFPIPQLPCQHHLQPEIIGVYGQTGGRSNRDGIQFGTLTEWKQAMGNVWWMTSNELSQAIPPVYTHWIATQFLSL